MDNWDLGNSVSDSIGNYAWYSAEHSVGGYVRSYVGYSVRDSVYDSVVIPVKISVWRYINNG